MNKRNSRFEDCLIMEAYTGVDFLESENLLVYSTDEYVEEQKRRRRVVYQKNLNTGKKEQITSGGVAEELPRFSPDGKKIAFLAVHPQTGRQLYLYDRLTQKVNQLTSIGVPVIDPVWSPKGDKILFMAPSIGSSKQTKPDEPVVIEQMHFKFDGRGFYRPDNYMHLWVVDVSTGQVARITEGLFNYMHHNWAPDGKSVVCGTNRFRRPEETIGMDLIKIDIEKGNEVTRLSDDQYLVSYPNPMRPVCTPDGKYVIAGFLNYELKEIHVTESITYPEVYLYKVAMDGSGKTCIFTPSDDCIQCVQFPYNAACGSNMDTIQLSEDGKRVYYLAGWHGRTVLYELEIDGDGIANPLLNEKCALNGIGKVQNGKMLMTRSLEVAPESYHIFNIHTRTLSKPILQCAEDLLSAVNYSQPEDFTFLSLDGDTEIHGWALPPQGYIPGEKYPVILYVHGGPQPFYTYGFSNEHQCFAGEGFGVLYCNFRGSTSYGWNHQQITKAYGGEAYIDNLQFVEEAIRRFDWIDPERMGVTGGSYGGFMTNYIATHAKRFKAYVTQRSVVSEVIKYASSDMGGMSRGYLSFDEFLSEKITKSPVAYADHIDKPFLILHGYDDLRTPMEGAHQLYTSIKDTHPDLPVKMVVFPHTSHGQPKNQEMLLKYYYEMVNWFKKYL